MMHSTKENKFNLILNQAIMHGYTPLFIYGILNSINCTFIISCNLKNSTQHNKKFLHSIPFSNAIQQLKKALNEKHLILSFSRMNKTYNNLNNVKHPIITKGESRSIRHTDI